MMLKAEELKRQSRASVGPTQVEKPGGRCPGLSPSLSELVSGFAYQHFVKPLAFLIDPETAHDRALSLIAKGLIRTRVLANPLLEQTLFGVHFPNPVGLAGGFDKSGVAVGHWHRLGFGFVEIGTVTPRAQDGNPRPRYFRLPQHQAIVNRGGFFNDGAAAVASRLMRAAPQIPVGVSLGKSKGTDLDRAARDHVESFELLRGLASYYVINVSSPNTPGLRTLQDKAPLVEIVQAIRAIDNSAPLFVKVAPDLELPALDDVLTVAVQEKLTGLIATNTTLSREGVSGPNAEEAGGLSGMPLQKRSDEVLAHLARARQDLVLIGVGGVFTGEDVFRKISLGAHLCQIYTGWIYGGPSTVPRLLRELLSLMDQRGLKSLDELRGSSL